MTNVAIAGFPAKPPTSFERQTNFGNHGLWQTGLPIGDSRLIDSYLSNSSSSSSCRGSLENLISGLLSLPTSTASWINLLKSDLLYAEKRAASVNIETASENLFELRRLTGFTWIQLASLLNVDRRTLNNWVRGRKIREQNRGHIAKALEVIRFADRGSAELNSAVLNERDAQHGLNPFEAIRDGKYTIARQFLSHGPSRPGRWQAVTDAMSRIGEFQPIVMHAGADGTETIKPLPDEPEPVSRKRLIRRG